MMSFQNQFSLSLELTRLVPLGLQVAGKSYEAAMRLARDLQASGSDIVVEEDLAELFGRSRISDAVSSSFRTTLTKPNPSETLGFGITLFRGAGPTVVRALLEKAYFSTVVQCSFLVAVHECTSLSACITRHFERLAELAPPDALRRAVPSAESIRGSLRAIEEQTERYEWTKQIHAVAAVLGLEDKAVFETIPSIIMQGLLSMLPLVQQLPEDRFIIIQTPKGAANIVAWAHILLGLTVSVEIEDQTGKRHVPFPMGQQGVVNVFVKTRTDSPNFDAYIPRISLSSAVERDELLSLVAENDDTVIDATSKYPARGFASRLISMPKAEGRDIVLQEMVYICCGYALSISHKLFKADLEQYPTLLDMDDFPVDLIQRVKIDDERIIDAAGLLFNISTTEISQIQAHEYERFYAGRDFSQVSEPPLRLAHIFEQWSRNNSRGEHWASLQYSVKQISTIILAFAHVADLGVCDEVPISSYHTLVSRSGVFKYIDTWNGRSKIPVKFDTWFEVLALMITGESQVALDLTDVALLSKRGWSVFVNTFGEADPYYSEPGWVAVKRGTPWRNGITKHHILDGPLAIFGSTSSFGELQMGGEIATLECAMPLEFAKFYVGEGADSFLVTLRIMDRLETKAFIMHTGFRELWRSHFIVDKLQPCHHSPRPREQLVLEPGWSTCNGIQMHRSFSPTGRFRICLTAGNTVTRWGTLLAVHELRSEKDVKLRGPQTCFQCTLSQAASEFAAHGGFVVL